MFWSVVVIDFPEHVTRLLMAYFVSTQRTHSHVVSLRQLSMPNLKQWTAVPSSPAWGCNLSGNWFNLPSFCSQPVAALARCQQRPQRWRTEVLDFCTGSHKSSSFTRRKSRTSNNPVPVLCIPSKYGWMSCSLNESNLNQLRHKLQPCSLRSRHSRHFGGTHR